MMGSLVLLSRLVCIKSSTRILSHSQSDAVSNLSVRGLPFSDIYLILVHSVSDMEMKKCYSESQILELQNWVRILAHHG